MNERNKSQTAFVGVTLITLLGVAFVLVVYATLLGTMLNPGNVFLGGVGSVAGTVKYSPNNVDTWQDSQSFGSATADWYARVELVAGYYYGPVVFTWKLQRLGGTWEDVSGGSNTTSITLSASTPIIYVSGSSATGNENWKNDVAGQQGTYQVYVTVDTAP